MTESLKNYIVYDSELEAIYLKGEFGVYSDKPFTADDEFAFMKDFYIGKAPQKVTEPTSEGLPFFRGTLSVSQKVIFPENVIEKGCLAGTQKAGQQDELMIQADSSLLLLVKKRTDIHYGLYSITSFGGFL